ncbi:sodium-dependent transporter [Clostridium sp. MB40-C1]|uniref:sodium-dependent transporter n=1 Tax=Clostridium sp. MB40-C1 TaxID=3070996 RepID=UPI0027E1EB7A|nr:sodium-dependent transporter [Clostridium sp. MB40-C1]WMJ80475.1 sodium-dependent transporter [Clostridium sp. MB40-C1]
MKRDNFGSRMGILAAAAGSAIGLGNIWKFPYITGKNGGAAFILVYLACIALVGVPVMVTEFALGRKTQKNAVGAYKEIEPNKPWYLSGFLAVSTAFIILSFYAIIAGWVFAYVSRGLTGKLMEVAPDQLGDYFGGIISSVSEPMIWTFIVIALTATVVLAGVKSGIEKCSKVLMPVLVLILVALMIRSVTLDGASKGLEFLFKPDFSQLTKDGVLEALGHSFYSLSLGMGIIMTYGSYINKKENLLKLAVQVTIADTLIALMAGIVIFPAVFAYGFKASSGPGLIFITLPAVFKAMPLGRFFATLFFILVAIAAITSTISLMEVVVAFVTEQFNISRKKAAIIIALALFALSIPSNLSMGPWAEFKIFGKNFFDFLDFLTSNIFLPAGGVLVSVFAGWIWGTKNAIKEIESDGLHPFKWTRVYNFAVKFLAPVAITVIFVHSTGAMKYFKGETGEGMTSSALYFIGAILVFGGVVALRVLKVKRESSKE